MWHRRTFPRLMPLSLLLITLLSLASACGGGSGGGGETEKTPPSATPYYDEKAIIEEARTAQNQIVSALESGESTALLGLLEQNVGIQMEGELDLTSPELREELARALSEAQPVKVYPGMVFYETTYAGETLSFYIIQEEGTWKLGGF